MRQNPALTSTQPSTYYWRSRQPEHQTKPSTEGDILGPLGRPRTGPVSTYGLQLEQPTPSGPVRASDLPVFPPSLAQQGEEPECPIRLEDILSRVRGNRPLLESTICSQTLVGLRMLFQDLGFSAPLFSCSAEKQDVGMALGAWREMFRTLAQKEMPAVHFLSIRPDHHWVVVQTSEYGDTLARVLQSQVGVFSLGQWLNGQSRPRSSMCGTLEDITIGVYLNHLQDALVGNPHWFTVSETRLNAWQKCFGTEIEHEDLDELSFRVEVLGLG